MRYLKPVPLFETFSCSPIDFEKLDIRILYKCFIEDVYNSSSGLFYLKTYQYPNKQIYSKIPRCIRYYMSEANFSETKFSGNDFYDIETPEDQIIADYILVFLNKYPDHRKTFNLYKKLKKINPEFFI